MLANPRPQPPVHNFGKAPLPGNLLLSLISPQSIGLGESRSDSTPAGGGLGQGKGNLRRFSKARPGPTCRWQRAVHPIQWEAPGNGRVEDPAHCIGIPAPRVGNNGPMWPRIHDEVHRERSQVHHPIMEKEIYPIVLKSGTRREALLPLDGRGAASALRADPT